MNDQDQWQIVLNRNAHFDGVFVYAVRSTGIYCRPSCSSRKPAQHHVSFFSKTEAAESAGYRACRRCRPEQPRTVDPRVQMVIQVCAHIDHHSDEALHLADLSILVGSSPHHLQRTFKKIMGISPKQYVNARRLAFVKSHIRETRNVAAAVYRAGYGSSSRLYERVSTEFGMTPASYGRYGKGVSIFFTIENCTLGRVLIATTERGICSVRLGDSANQLEQTLRDEFREAQIFRDDARLAPAVRTVLQQLEGKAASEYLPLDIRATAFQCSVWEKLRRIPIGNTSSYSEIAKEIGNAKAARAVARACGSNPVAVLIPCHRVVARSGDLGGYRWGIKRKKELLAKERAASTLRQ